MGWQGLPAAGACVGGLEWVDVHDTRGQRIGGIAFRDAWGDSRMVAIVAAQPDSGWLHRRAANFVSAIWPASPLAQSLEEVLMTVIERFSREHGIDAQRDPLIFGELMRLSVRRGLGVLRDHFLGLVVGRAASVILNHAPGASACVCSAK